MDKYRKPCIIWHNVGGHNPAVGMGSDVLPVIPHWNRTRVLAGQIWMGHLWKPHSYQFHSGWFFMAEISFPFFIMWLFLWWCVLFSRHVPSAFILDHFHLFHGCDAVIMVKSVSPWHFHKPPYIYKHMYTNWCVNTTHSKETTYKKSVVMK